MMKQRKTISRIFLITISLFMLIVSGGQPAFAYTYKKIPTAGVFINGKVVNGINPIQWQGVYYVPLTQLAKILGYNSISFNNKTLTYEMTDGSTKVRVTMGGSRAKKGNEYINIKPPRWIDGTGYISMDAGSALFNIYMYFKPENGSVQIERPARKYVVHSGDSLWSIARAHHITVQELKAANNLKSNIIYDGQVLHLPKGTPGKEMEPAKKEEPVPLPKGSNVTAVRDQVINIAKKYIGAGYKFGATLQDAPHLFDCSSYTMLVFQQAGIQLPRVSRDQAEKGTRVTSLVKGDLLFFTNNDIYTDGRVSHVGIYMGNGDMIHASTSKGVTITKDVLSNPYWSKNYLFSKRIIH